MTDYTFTPFEQVLVRDNDDDFWKVCEPARNHFYFGKDREEDKL